MFSKCDGEPCNLHKDRHVDSDTREQPKPQEEAGPDKIQIFGRLPDLSRFPEPTS
jgi:hypothetical protein